MTKKENDIRIYCGPSVRGVAKQYTSFKGELPTKMKDFVKAHPMAESLIIPCGDLARVRSNLEQRDIQGKPKPIEKIIFEKLKEEL